MKPGSIAQLRAQCRAAGAQATYAGDVALYGTRRTPDVDAGDATPSRTAIGIGKASVWNGPRKIKGGAPVLKRNITS